MEQNTLDESGIHVRWCTGERCRGRVTLDADVHGSEVQRTGGSKHDPCQLSSLQHLLVIHRTTTTLLLLLCGDDGGGGGGDGDGGGGGDGDDELREQNILKTL